MTTQLSDFKGQGESSCCGAGTYGEYLICEDCGEHCGDVSNEKNLIKLLNYQYSKLDDLYCKGCHDKNELHEPHCGKAN